MKDFETGDGDELDHSLTSSGEDDEITQERRYGISLTLDTTPLGAEGESLAPGTLSSPQPLTAEEIAMVEEHNKSLRKLLEEDLPEL